MTTLPNIAWPPKLAMKAAVTTAPLASAMACVILMFGDKILLLAIAGSGIRLGFVWVLKGCLGGFEVRRPVGPVVGPVAPGLLKELWKQRVRDVAAFDRAMYLIES